ncbi:MAG: carboxypeptidase regulatory-like domain-containing protein [Planctomycetes bacterium]|nr:carboxypeptidase regulatory-like domain-containing protein [Planctomycetota bacterium]
MNRGLLISLLVLTIAAIAAVLFYPSDDPGLFEHTNSESPNTGNGGPSSAALQNGGTRVASNDSSDAISILESDPTTILGQVTSASDGKPVPLARLCYAHRQFGGANVGWSPQAVQTIGIACDAKGRFRMPSAGSELSLQIMVWAPGYSLQRVPGLKLGEVIEIVLKPSVNVHGTVFNPQGNPSPGVVVELFDPTHKLDGYPVQGRTDAEGKFDIPASLANGASLRVRSAAGSCLIEGGIDVAPNMKSIRVELGGRLSLAGMVNDSAGRAVAGAHIKISKVGERLEIGADSNNKGEVELFGLGGGEWRGEVSAEGFASQDFELTLTEGTPTTHNWTILRNSSLRVNVSDGKSRPLPGAYIQLLPNPTGDHAKMRFPLSLTDSEGIAIFAQVPPGNYVVGPENSPGMGASVLFEKEGKAGGKGTAHFSSLVDVAPGQETVVSLVLKRHGVLTVQVVRNGQPVVGARAFLVEPGKVPPKRREANDFSDLQGNLSFPAVWMGDYQLEVQGSPSEIASSQPISCGRGVNQFTFELPDGIVTGLVQDSQGALANVQIMGAAKGKKYLSMGSTDANGNFELAGFEVGVYQLRIEAAGHTAWENLELHHNGAAVKLGTIELAHAHALKGTVTGLKPNPNDFIGPVITATDATGKSLATLPLNTNGSYSMTGLPGGNITLKVLSSGRELYTKTVSIPQKNGILNIDI